MNMRFSNVLLVFVLIATSSLFPASACPSANRSIYLAAVIGEGDGGLFRLEVEVRPGNGTVYTAVAPRTSFSVQESEELAVSRAFERSGLDEGACDVLFRIAGPVPSSTIDGSSAGAAMEVAVRAAITGKEIRDDVVMTGTVTDGDLIGDVGGIIEKAMAAYSYGKTYFLVPSAKVHEALLISSLTSPGKFSMMVVSSLPEAEEIIFSDYSKEFDYKFKPVSKPLPQGLKELEIDFELARFSIVAKNVIDRLNSRSGEYFAGREQSGEMDVFKEYFEEEISKYYSLQSKGYLYTSANAAFLLLVDAEYIRLGGGDIDLEEKAGEIGECLAALPDIEKTKENIHWAIGADLRRHWSRMKLNETLSGDSLKGYTSLRDLLFAGNWCEISDELSLQAKEVGGSMIDERVLSSLASRKLSEAAGIFVVSDKVDYDALWHLSSALEANKSGDFGAAIYDSTYAIAMQEIYSEKLENVSDRARRLAERTPTSLWGKIYHGQGAYLYYEALDNSAAPNDAYRILRFSEELDKVSGEIEEEIIKDGIQNGITGNAPPIFGERGRSAPAECLKTTGSPVSWLLAIAVLALGLLFAMRLLGDFFKKRGVGI